MYHYDNVHVLNNVSNQGSWQYVYTCSYKYTCTYSGSRFPIVVCPKSVLFPTTKQNKPKSIQVPHFSLCYKCPSKNIEGQDS